MFSLNNKNKFKFTQYKHGYVILKHAFSNEYEDIKNFLTNFIIKKSWLMEGGGRKSKISIAVDDFLIKKKSWIEKEFLTSIKTDGISRENPTHKIDCYKNRVAFELEWNNKTEFYDRDLNNFRILYELDNISLGIIMTRSTTLDTLLRNFGIIQKYGASTTHSEKLLKKINGGGSGGCPLIVIEILQGSIDDNN